MKPLTPIARYYHARPVDNLDPAPHDYYAHAAHAFYWRAARLILFLCFLSLFGISLGAMITSDYLDSSVAAVTAIALLGLRAILKLR